MIPQPNSCITVASPTTCTPSAALLLLTLVSRVQSIATGALQQTWHWCCGVERVSVDQLLHRWLVVSYELKAATWLWQPACWPHADAASGI